MGRGGSDLESGLDVAFFGEGHDNMTSLVHKNTVISTISIVYKKGGVYWGGSGNMKTTGTAVT